jgi:hypothetical protein
MYINSLVMPSAPRPTHLGTGDSTNPMPRKRRPSGRQAFADNYRPSLHNDPRSLPSDIVLGVLFAPSVSRKLPAEAETARNSFAWNILQGTSLLSIFCSATLLVTSRKQGFCAQSMGGGTR